MAEYMTGMRVFEDGKFIDKLIDYNALANKPVVTIQSLDEITTSGLYRIGDATYVASIYKPNVGDRLNPADGFPCAFDNINELIGTLEQDLEYYQEQTGSEEKILPICTLLIDGTIITEIHVNMTDEYSENWYIGIEDDTFGTMYIYQLTEWIYDKVTIIQELYNYYSYTDITVQNIPEYAEKYLHCTNISKIATTDDLTKQISHIVSNTVELTVDYEDGTSESFYLVTR